MAICSSDFCPISTAFAWRKRAPFTEMSETSTGDDAKRAFNGGPMRKRSAVRRLLAAASYIGMSAKGIARPQPSL